eukprot:scaffold954_cov173-Ochromonas_danica.AAC.25
MHVTRVEPEPKSVSVIGAEETEVLKTREITSLKYEASPLQVFFMGVGIIIGGQFMDWNEALMMGLWECLISLTVVAIGYVCLTFCLAEMASILPFAGGSFGYVRCSLGPRVGYDTGLCESVAYILFVSASLDSVDEIIRAAAGLSSTASFYIYIAFYGFGIPFMCIGGPCIWWWSVVFAIVALALVGIYCISNIPNDDVMYFPSNQHVGQSMMSYLRWFPLMTWFFKGIEPLTLACNNVDEPGKKLPRVMISVILLMVFTAFCILLTTGSIPPYGPVDLADYPHFMAYGFFQGLNITKHKALVGLLALPPTIGTAYGYMYAFGQQLQSMAQSGLLPSFLKRTCGSYDAPYAAVLTGSLISLAVLFILHVTVNDISETLFGICMLSTCMVNVCLCAAFVVYRQRYSALEHEFTNPMGIASACIGALIFTFIAVALAFFHQDNYTAVTYFVVIVVLGVLYYHFVAKKTECFSKEEQEKFFKAYVLNANVIKRQNMKKKLRHNSVSPTSRDRSGNRSHSIPAASSHSESNAMDQ